MRSVKFVWLKCGVGEYEVKLFDDEKKEVDSTKLKAYKIDELNLLIQNTNKKLKQKDLQSRQGVLL